MKHAPDITVILPAYNEAAAIETAVRDVAAYFAGRGMRYEIIVAADGDDGTRELVRRMAGADPAIQVFGRPGRAGKGLGIRDAVAIAEGAIIGYMDADNKVPVEEFEKLEPYLRAGYELATGSRAMSGSRIERRQPWYRRVGSKGFHLFMQTLVGLPGIHDSQCGFKFFRRDVAKRIFACQKIDGYMFDVEILALAQRMGYRIAQAPIRWRDDGDSRLELFKGNLQNVVDILRIRRSLRGVERCARTAAANV
ncbi:MAG: glycosyltransferase family 2 protein [Bryobacteraceae bacterium]|nr:glycosyltransferase family 2 protein [Bryobacteraceae bacterium]